MVIHIKVIYIIINIKDKVYIIINILIVFIEEIGKMDISQEKDRLYLEIIILKFNVNGNKEKHVKLGRFIMRMGMCMRGSWEGRVGMGGVSMR